MKKIIILLSAVTTIVVGACSAIAAKESKSENHEKAVFDLTKLLVDNDHYNRQDLNDEFSKKAFEKLLESADPNKRFLLQKDVDKLSTYKFKIDDAFKTNDLSVFEEYVKIIEKREDEAKKILNKLFDSPISLERKDSIEFDEDKLGYAVSSKELKLRWEQYFTSQVIEKLYALEKKQEENDSIDDKKSLDELEVEARESIVKRDKDWLKRLDQLERSDRYSMFLNSILAIYGPHTNYYPPKDKEDFDISMSGKLEGIGATLTVKDGYVKVSKIIAGSACWKQGELEAGDLILEVAQGDSTPVNVYDMRLDKAVRLIRGPKGTEVRLTVKKVDGSSKVIPIIRDEVVIEETYAKSLILKENGDTTNYGYIHLGSFYAEFGKRNGKRCSKDVLNQIEALQASNVEGLILDLRNNGGGSLSDAVDMVGYFIKHGPVVQVDGVGQEPQEYSDRDPNQQFDKPMVVMINNFSASASEIFAAAIQDYHRGVIVGSNSFGKGTVQRFFPLQNVSRRYGVHKGEGELGEVKQTIAKFFRINGGATQLKGVEPDVKLPDVYDHVDIGEKEYDHALAWTSIRQAAYSTYNFDFDIPELQSATKNRIDTSSYFQSVIKNAEAIKLANDETIYPLNYNQFKAFKKARKEKSDAAKVIEQKINDWSVELNKLDLYQAKGDTVLQDRLKKFKDNTADDHYIRESLRVLREIK